MHDVGLGEKACFSRARTADHKGVEVAAVIKQATEDKSFRVSMRSSCDFDVSEICAHYGGGGHARAAGCTLLADSILAAEMAVVVAVEQRMQDEEINE